MDSQVDEVQGMARALSRARPRASLGEIVRSRRAHVTVPPQEPPASEDSLMRKQQRQAAIAKHVTRDATQ